MKYYLGVWVNDGVCFEVVVGEIYVVFGENGVGKLMLMKIIYGVIWFDFGCMLWEGRLVWVISFEYVWWFGIVMVF